MAIAGALGGAVGSETEESPDGSVTFTPMGYFCVGVIAVVWVIGLTAKDTNSLPYVSDGTSDTGDIDYLVDSCLDGDMSDCDYLWQITDVGSEEEYIGASCGYRCSNDFIAGSCDS